MEGRAVNAGNILGRGRHARGIEPGVAGRVSGIRTDFSRLLVNLAQSVLVAAQFLRQRMRSVVARSHEQALQKLLHRVIAAGANAHRGTIDLRRFFAYIHLLVQVQLVDDHER